MEIIETSDKPESFKKSARECLDDKDRLIGKMNLICPEPTREFILQYRPVIEQDCLKFYKSTMNKIFKALNITGNSFNDKQIKLVKKPTSVGLIKAYIQALYEISGLDVELTEYSKSIIIKDLKTVEFLTIHFIIVLKNGSPRSATPTIPKIINIGPHGEASAFIFAILGCKSNKKCIRIHGQIRLVKMCR